MTVFARDGYHTSRVADIASEAGIAHGLLYHYFPSKEAVLATLFSENWADLLARFRAVEASAEPADEKLRGLVKILLRTWQNNPALVTVMVREVAQEPAPPDAGRRGARGVRVDPAGHRAGPGGGDVPPETRSAARQLGRVRSTRGDPHRLGARPAPGR